MILIEQDAVLVEDGRARRAVVVVELAHGGPPEDGAFEVERDETVGAERSEDRFAVGDGRRGSVTIFRVRVLDASLRDRGLPELLARRAAIGEHRETPAGVVRRGEEDPVSPDDGRGVAFAGHRHFPDHVLRRGPAVGISGARHVALPRGSTPARPVGRALPFDGNHRDVFGEQNGEARQESAREKDNRSELHAHAHIVSRAL